MSIDIPVTHNRDGSHEPLAAELFRTSQGSTYVPELCGDGRMVYRRHKYDGVEYEPHDLTVFISDMTLTDVSRCLDVVHKKNSAYTQSYQEHLSDHVCVLYQQLEGSEDYILVRNPSDVAMDAADVLLAVGRVDAEGQIVNNKEAFVKKVSLVPTVGARVLEFDERVVAEGITMLVPTHLGHEVVTF